MAIGTVEGFNDSKGYGFEVPTGPKGRQASNIQAA